MSERKLETERRLRSILRQFPLYGDCHHVHVYSEDGNSYIGYGELRDRIHSLLKTQLDLQITNDTCFILSFSISQEKRR
jgi:hypothetical protein